MLLLIKTHSMILDTNHLKNFLIFKMPKMSTVFQNYLDQPNLIENNVDSILPQFQIYQSKKDKCYYCFAAFPKSTNLKILDFIELFKIESLNIQFFSRSGDFVLEQKKLLEKKQLCLILHWGGPLVFTPIPSYWLDKDS